MQSKALFVTMQAGSGNGERVATWLREALTPIADEPETRDWFALRFGPDSFAIFDTFDGNRGRLTHLLGKVGRGLVVRTFTMLSGLPDIAMTDVVAARVSPGDQRLTAAVRTHWIAGDGQGRNLAAALVEELEHATIGDGTARYVLRLRDDTFLLLDFTADGASVPDVSERLSASGRVAGLPAQAEILAYKLGSLETALSPSALRATSAAR